MPFARSTPGGISTGFALLSGSVKTPVSIATA
jgi:hypothetical protein